jgi:hypothetical protein
MDGSHAPTGPWVYLIPLIAVAMVVLRNARERKLKVERLWISPVLFLVLTAITLANQPAPGPVLLATEAAALVLGALAGWWRGRLTRITVDPATHALTSRPSPLGMLLILALFAVRYALRSFGAQTAGALHLSAVVLTDVLMLLAVGIVCAQRLEIALRATRLLNAARAERSSP